MERLEAQQAASAAATRHISISSVFLTAHSVEIAPLLFPAVGWRTSGGLASHNCRQPILPIIEFPLRSKVSKRRRCTAALGRTGRITGEVLHNGRRTMKGKRFTDEQIAYALRQPKPAHR
jgi:hypothetical protein